MRTQPHGGRGAACCGTFVHLPEGSLHGTRRSRSPLSHGVRLLTGRAVAPSPDGDAPAARAPPTARLTPPKHPSLAVDGARSGRMGAPPDESSGSGGESVANHDFRENGTNAHTDVEEVMIARVAAVASLAVGDRGRRGGPARRGHVVHAARRFPGRRRPRHRRRRADGSGARSVRSSRSRSRPTARRRSRWRSTRARRRCTRARWRGSTRTRCRASPPGTSCSSRRRATRPTIPNGGTIGEDHTYSFVSLDQVFDSLDPLTRAGLRGFIQGEAASIQGRVGAGQQDAQVPRSRAGQHQQPDRRARPQRAGVRRAARPGRADDAGAGVAGAAAERPDRAGEHDDRRDRAPERRRSSRRSSCSRARSTARRPRSPDSTARSTRSTRWSRKSKIAARRLEPFAASLNTFAKVAIPTVAALSDLIHNPAGTGDLTTLFEQTPKLAQLAATAFPNLIKAMNASQTQLDNLREYTPDVVAALTNVGQASGYYDANGHYIRVQPTFFAFGIDSSNQLVRAVPADRYQGLQMVTLPLPRWRRPARRPTARRRTPSPAASPARRPAADHETDRADRTRAGARPRRSPAVASASGGPGGDPYHGARDLRRRLVRGAGRAGAGCRRAGRVDRGRWACTAGKKAAVTLEINDARFTPFHADATCAIRPQSLIGEMYVDCNPGTAAAPALHAASTPAPARATTTCRSPGRARRSTSTSSRTSTRSRWRSGSRSSSTSSAPAWRRADRT